ncbi:MAG: hypothetical protein M1840_003532 [Geoglossum simile]|nr:MAG: hypothetical protein M1840_003532 [Geoglossum simile]
MSCTPSKVGRRVLQDVAVNVSGTPTKPLRLSPTKIDNRAVFFPIEEQENEDRLRGSSIGKKRTIDKVDCAVSRADIARPALGERVETRGNEKTLARHKITKPNTTNGGKDMTSEPTASDQTRESAQLSRETQKPSNEQLEYKMPTMAGQQNVLDLLVAPRSHISTPTSRTNAKKHAEMLRIRLKFAMYKVKTNQIHVPMSELQFLPREPAKSLPKPSIPAASSAPETISLQPTLSKPKLLPAPLLVPTAYSARPVTEPYMPSSPPCSAPNSDEDSPDLVDSEDQDFTTPIASRENRVILRSPVQLSSPPSSEKRVVNRSRIYDAEGRLTSSMVKGRAADGLLELLQS